MVRRNFPPYCRGTLEGMDTRTFRIQLGYWAGAFGCALMLIHNALLFSRAMTRPEFFGSSAYLFMVGHFFILLWIILLLWGARKPLERRSLLLMTFFPLIVNAILKGVEAYRLNWTSISLIFQFVLNLFLAVLVAIVYVETKPYHPKWWPNR